MFIRHLAPLYLTNHLRVPAGQASMILIAISVMGIFSPPLFSALSERENRKAVLMGLALALAATFIYLPSKTRLSYATLAVLGLLAFLT